MLVVGKLKSEEVAAAGGQLLEPLTAEEVVPGLGNWKLTG